jgi:hypothetical protein
VLPRWLVGHVYTRPTIAVRWSGSRVFASGPRGRRRRRRCKR